MTTFAANPIYSIMYSSEDLERFYFQYQTEALPHGESLQSFCVKNKVSYNIFQKWFKKLFWIYRAMIWDEFLRHFRFCDEEDSGLSDEEQERKA